MKIWIDILTPKQLLFFEGIVEKLRKNHDVLCTTRKYNEVIKLAKIRKFDMKVVGTHGGLKNQSKLDASIKRMKSLSEIIQKFKPDLTLSSCSPEASRIAFGLGIKHYAFCDSPHATAVMRLTIPLVQKLFIPWVISKDEFTKFGIGVKNIIQYKAIDAAVTIQRPIIKSEKLPILKNKKNIVIRIEEEFASYISKSNNTEKIIQEITKRFDSENILILGRYPQQVKKYKNIFKNEIKVLDMSVDGRYILQHTDVFIGSGGTMTAESSLMGVPTISYNAVPNPIEKYLVQIGLIKRETNPKRIAKLVKVMINNSRKEFQHNAKKIQKTMNDPYEVLLKSLKKWIHNRKYH